MSVIDHLRTPPAETRAPQVGQTTADLPSPGDLSEADDLVADLVALVDAGLVVVRRQLGGPLRYVAAGEDNEPA